jgi:plastocyanin
LLPALACLPASAYAAGISVTVLDRDGRPVPDVAVWVDGVESGNHEERTVVMDQVDSRFVPHVLVIQTGTRVEFPNSDVIAHHVYSFSDPNDFMLPLYKGEAHAPVRFDSPGVVTLGCNIHDQMLAYILVVDTPSYSKTDSDGKAHLDPAPNGKGTVTIWSPRIKSKSGAQTLPVSANVEFRLNDELRPEHGETESGIEWSDY